MYLSLDPSKVPESLRPLIPLAEKFGIADDLERERFAKGLSAHELKYLKQMITVHDDALDEWLAGPEAASLSPSNEYVAFSAMRMAADFFA